VVAGLLVGVGVFLVGLVVTFAGAGPRGRVRGFTLLAFGAVLAVATAPPRPSWVVAVTVALTLVPLVVIADVLGRRLEARPDRDPVTLDDDPR
jgi:hydrogenase-4 membrane subunit HyfE